MTSFHRPLTSFCMLLSLSACAMAPSDITEGRAFTASAEADGGISGLLRLADASLAGGDVDGGIKLLRQVVTRYPDSLEAQRALAEAFFGVGALPEAFIAFDQMRMLDRGQMEGLLGLGRVALAKGDAASAIGYFAKALESDPDEGRASNGLAVAYDYSSRHEEAQEIYNKILARNPADHAVANNLALSQALSGSIGPAIAGLSDLASGPAYLPEARFNLALAYGMGGDLAAAREILEDELDSQAVADNLAFYRRISPAAGGGSF